MVNELLASTAELEVLIATKQALVAVELDSTYRFPLH